MRCRARNGSDGVRTESVPHGPAHKKTFTVILQLGQEEYQATGPSIKKAQHAAASNAMQATIRRSA